MDRIEREKKTVEQMIRLYCRHHHGGPMFLRYHLIRADLCDECRELLEYAHARLSHCPHGNGKPSCRKCTVHCYAPRRRMQIKRVMAYAGPQMLMRNPVAAIRHLISEFRR